MKSVLPVVQPSRKIPDNLRQKLSGNLTEQEEIEKVEGPTTWVSPLVIVSKRDGDIRIIVDMRVANQAIQRERHPIPTVEETVQEISGGCHFSKLDLCFGYHQLELDAASQEKLTFQHVLGCVDTKG